MAEHYLNCESSEEKDSSLITDMLKFGVSGLFSIDSSKDEQAITEFENDLQGFIKRLKSSPILQIDDIMVMDNLVAHIFLSTICCKLMGPAFN